MGLVRDGTDLHGGGREGAVYDISGKFHLGMFMFGSQCGS
jgi:hypothetical protein